MTLASIWRLHLCYITFFYFHIFISLSSITLTLFVHKFGPNPTKLKWQTLTIPTFPFLPDIISGTGGVEEQIDRKHAVVVQRPFFNMSFIGRPKFEMYFFVL
jgi:hypothetical protein